MRAAVGIFYWVVVAVLALNAVYVSVAESRLWAGLLAPAALLVTRFLADQIVGMDWSCSEVAFDGISNPSGGTFGCTVVSIDLVLFGLCMWAMALLGGLKEAHRVFSEVQPCWAGSRLLGYGP